MKNGGKLCLLNSLMIPWDVTKEKTRLDHRRGWSWGLWWLIVIIGAVIPSNMSGSWDNMFE